jgi:hypothetical protein
MSDEQLNEAANNRPYPRFFQTIVGVAPSTMKTFTVEDVAALFDLFRTITGEDALTTKRPLREIIAETVGV